MMAFVLCVGGIEEDEEDEEERRRKAIALSLCWWFVMAAHRCNAICTIDVIGSDD
jgi:hypothetical protein